MYTVLVSPGCHPDGLDLLRQNNCAVVTMDPATEESITAGIRNADAVLIRIHKLTEKILRQAPKLRIVSRNGVGFDNVDVAHLSSRGIPMALAVDSNIVSVTEHTLLFLLMLFKDYAASDREQREGNFSYRDAKTAMDMAGKHLLVMGYGRIGRCVAQTCKALGMTVHVYDPLVCAADLAEGLRHVADYRAALPAMDAVTLHTPLTPETENCIGENEIASMKKTAVVVNCARGGLIDEAALYRALKEGRLRGAGIDAFAQEPPDKANPLFSLESCRVTPHNAALTEECARRMTMQAAQNILDCFAGRLEPRVIANRRELGL